MNVENIHLGSRYIDTCNYISFHSGNHHRSHRQVVVDRAKLPKNTSKYKKWCYHIMFVSAGAGISIMLELELSLCNSKSI